MCFVFLDKMIVCAHNYFSKTLEDINSGSKGSVLFITQDCTAFQIKKKTELHSECPVFKGVKRWNPNRLPSHASVAVCIEEMYTEREKPL